MVVNKKILERPDYMLSRDSHLEATYSFLMGKRMRPLDRHECVRSTVEVSLAQSWKPVLMPGAKSFHSASLGICPLESPLSPRADTEDGFESLTAHNVDRREQTSDSTLVFSDVSVLGTTTTYKLV